MNIYIGQIYIEPGVSFDFSTPFQKFIHQELTKLTKPSEYFSSKYGSDWSIIFRMSAKKKLGKNEIRGPSIYRKDKDIEYTIFLPFDLIIKDNNIYSSALIYLFKGIYEVLVKLKIDISDLQKHETEIIENICSDEKMFSIFKIL